MPSKIIILDTKNFIEKGSFKKSKVSILREWILYISQFFRLKKVIHQPSFILIMGTLNPFAVILFRLFYRTKVYVRAGGFAYYYDPRFLKIMEKFKSYFNKFVEFVTISLTNYLIVDSKNMVKYIPSPIILKNIIIRSKTFTWGSLGVASFDTKPMIRIPPSKRSPVIGYIGDLTQYRSVLELVYSFKLLSKMLPELKFIIIGSGQLENQIKSFIENNPDLRSKLLFYPYMPYKYVLRILEKMKLLVFPTKQDGLPNILVEAMFHGCLVLTTPIGGIPDIVTDYETGFFLSDTTPISIARKVLQILSLDPRILDRIALNAYNNVRKKYSFTSTIIKWKHIFNVN
jgi:glycosyltransferase involved in cell wall biosynthesis